MERGGWDRGGGEVLGEKRIRAAVAPGQGLVACRMGKEGCGGGVTALAWGLPHKPRMTLMPSVLAPAQSTEHRTQNTEHSSSAHPK